MLSLVALATLYVGPTDLTFVRHGETEANATGHYNARTLNTFSRKGEAGVAALTKQLLAQPRFNRILVSPSPRALKTIAPYLRATRQQATVWPLLYECCTGRRPKGAHPTSFKYAGKIEIPADLRGLFIVLPSANRLPDAPDYNSGLAQVQASVEEFHRFYSKGRVLLVGHSGHGGQFLHALTGRWTKIDNATEYHFTLK